MKLKKLIMIILCSILDDIEMYEQQKPFVIRDYILMSSFLNIFLYKGISQNLFRKKLILFLLLTKYVKLIKTFLLFWIS